MSFIGIRASIDIGSNSILLLVARFCNSTVEVLESESRITSLGYKLDESKVFHQNSMNSSYEALSEFKDICATHEIETQDITVSATEASRVATNAKDFYAKVKSELGVNVSIITPEAEAFYSAKGILFKGNFKENFIYVLDVGGASSEIIKIDTKKSELVSSFSLPIGSVRATDWMKSDIYLDRVADIKNHFEDEISISSSDKIVCVGGTITSLACISMNLEEFSENSINNINLSVATLKELHSKIVLMTNEDIVRKYNFLGKRSKSIVGGLKAILTIIEWLECSQVKVLTYGLRYGTLLDGGIKDEYIIK